MSRKIYVKWRPSELVESDEKVEQVWTENDDRPPAELADGKTLTVFDVLVGGQLENERPWDGIE